MEVLASDYVSGGYYVTTGGAISGSSCRAEFFPDAWAIEWTNDSVEERLKHASAFGILEAELPGVIAWATSAMSRDFGWPNVFYTLDGALEARKRFLADGEAVVFGLGLHRSNVEAFLEAAKPPPPTQGYSPVGETGVFQCVRAGAAIAGGGEALGFELLAMMFGIFTLSWSCNGLAAQCASQLDVSTNDLGLARTYDEAMRCTAFAAWEETKTDPGLWLPWLVTVYHL